MERRRGFISFFLFFSACQREERDGKKKTLAMLLSPPRRPDAMRVSVLCFVWAGLFVCGNRA